MYFVQWKTNVFGSLSNPNVIQLGNGWSVDLIGGVKPYMLLFMLGTQETKQSNHNSSGDSPGHTKRF